MARLGIYGHTSVETAHMIDDYPYGRLRCKRRVWLESDAKHGFRFVAQTENPKNGRWNAPKKSTYTEIAACLYLDEIGHVQWTGITPYTEAKDALVFVQDFGKNCAGAEQLREYAIGKARYAGQCARGERFFTINGVKQEPRETDIARHTRDAELWAEVSKLLTEG